MTVQTVLYRWWWTLSISLAISHRLHFALGYISADPWISCFFFFQWLTKFGHDHFFSPPGTDPRVLLPTGDVCQLESVQTGINRRGRIGGRCCAASLGLFSGRVHQNQQDGKNYIQYCSDGLQYACSRNCVINCAPSFWCHTIISILHSSLWCMYWLPAWRIGTRQC